MDKLRKKKTDNKEDSSREDTVLVYRCHMLKLKELTHLLNCKRLLKAVSCHHRSSFVPPSAIS